VSGSGSLSSWHQGPLLAAPARHANAAKQPFTNLAELSDRLFLNRTPPASASAAGCPSHWPGRTDSIFSDHQSPQANLCRDSGNSRIGLPVSAASAFTTAGAIGGSGGSPTPPIASPDSMMIVSMRDGDCVMRSSG
jgi:hypothetical protein